MSDDKKPQPKKPVSVPTDRGHEKLSVNPDKVRTTTKTKEKK